MVGPVQNSALDLVAHVDAGISAPGEHATASGRRWILRKFDPAAQQALQDFDGVSPVLARVMAARGVMASDADAFLAPSLKRSLPDPHVLHDMAPAALRLAAAVQAGGHTHIGSSQHRRRTARARRPGRARRPSPRPSRAAPPPPPTRSRIWPVLTP